MPPGALPPTTVPRTTTSRPADVGALKLVNLPPPGSLSPVPAIAMRQPPRAKNTPSRPGPRTAWNATRLPAAAGASKLRKVPPTRVRVSSPPAARRRLPPAPARKRLGVSLVPARATNTTWQPPPTAGVPNSRYAPPPGACCPTRATILGPPLRTTIPLEPPTPVSDVSNATQPPATLARPRSSSELPKRSTSRPVRPTRSPPCTSARALPRPVPNRASAERPPARLAPNTTRSPPAAGGSSPADFPPRAPGWSSAATRRTRPGPSTTKRPSCRPRKTPVSALSRTLTSAKRKPRPRSFASPSTAKRSTRPARTRTSPGAPSESVARTRTLPSSASATSRSRTSLPTSVGSPTATTAPSGPAAAATNTPADGTSGPSRVARNATSPPALTHGASEVGKAAKVPPSGVASPSSATVPTVGNAETTARKMPARGPLEMLARNAPTPASFSVPRPTEVNAPPAGLASPTTAIRPSALPSQLKRPSGPLVTAPRKATVPPPVTPITRRLVKAPPAGESAPVRVTSPRLPSGSATKTPVVPWWSTALNASQPPPPSATSLPKPAKLRPPGAGCPTWATAPTLPPQRSAIAAPPPTKRARKARQSPPPSAGPSTPATVSPSTTSPAPTRCARVSPVRVKTAALAPTKAARPRSSSATSEKRENGRPSGERSPTATSTLGAACAARAASTRARRIRVAPRTAPGRDANPMPLEQPTVRLARPRAGARLRRSCNAATASVLGPEVPDQLRQVVERRSAIDPALAPAPAAADHGHVAQLGQARERIPEGDHRVALGLVHLAEEEAGLELALHALHERALQDRPLLLRGRSARQDQVGLEEVLEDAGRGADEGVVERGPVPHQRARLAVVREPAPDLGRQRLALRERELPAVEVEPPANVRAQRAERHLGQERAREQRGDQEEVDRVVLVEVEVDALGGRHVQDDAARVHQAVDQPAPREPVEALLEVRLIVALERGRDPRPLSVQQPGERVRRGEEVAHAARGARRAQERRGAHRRGPRHRGVVHGAQQAEAQALDEAALLLLPLRVAEPGREALARGPEDGVQRDRVRIAHVDRPVAALEHAARAQERPERLAPLLLAGDLALVGLLLRNAPVVHGDGHEVEVPPHALDEGVQDGRQHAQLWGEDLPRPRPPALDEELLRVALADQEGEVLPEDHLVELVVLEGAADEEGARAAEERPHGPEAQVVAGRDVGRGEVVQVEDVGEDQVVEVAAVAGDEHHRVLLHALDDLLEADDLQAGEHARPDAVEDGLQEAEVEAVEVGGHLVEVTARLLPHPAAREASLGRDAAHQAG